MKLYSILATSLWACSVAASPAPSPTQEWKAVKYNTRNMEIGNSKPMIQSKWTEAKKKHGGQAVKADLGSQNWGGAMHIANGELVTSVAATFTVPTPSLPTNQSPKQFSGATWVGLGGYGANTSLWNAGTSWSIDNSVGMTTSYNFSVWYQWQPNGIKTIPGFSVFPGHVITVNLNADRPGTGAVVIADKTTGQTTSITTSAPNPTATLNGQSGEWIVEDPTINGALAPLANFYKVAFTGCAYGNTAGVKGSASGATLIHLADSSNKEEGQPSIPNSGEVDVLYVY